ncbi:MAG: acyl carrier protein [Proteobacteria bacterium]|nr:acyl carrier protein [Pseudomonadota bacterium]NBP16052.1 acyl carrier protein [bacterium]
MATKTELTETVTQLVTQILEKEEPIVITPAMHLKDLGMDKFDLIELVMKLEDQLSIMIDDADIEGFDSIESVVEYIAEKRIE